MTEREQRRRAKEIVDAYNSGDLERAEKLYTETLVDLIARPVFPSSLLYRDRPEFIFRDTPDGYTTVAGPRGVGEFGTGRDDDPSHPFADDVMMG